MKARILLFLLTVFACFAGCAVNEIPFEYAPSKIWIGSRSTPMEAVNLLQHAMWEGNTDVAYEVLSEKTKKEYGKWDFWFGTSLTFPLLELDDRIDPKDYFSIEHFLKFAKVKIVKTISPVKVLARWEIELESGGNTIILSYLFIIIKERDGWAIPLVEMFEQPDA
ncbi:MAG: hypothetical protein ACYS8W_14905 [Planctomycetota bacterium]